MPPEREVTLTLMLTEAAMLLIALRRVPRNMIYYTDELEATKQEILGLTDKGQSIPKKLFLVKPAAKEPEPTEE